MTESEIGVIKKKLTIWLKLAERLNMIIKQTIQSMTEYYSLYENQGLNISKGARQFITEMLSCEDPTKLTQLVIVFGNSLEMIGNLYIAQFCSFRVELNKEIKNRKFNIQEIEDSINDTGLKTLKQLEQYEADFQRASKDYEKAFQRVKEMTKDQVKEEKELKYFVSTKEKIDEKIKAAAIQLEEKEINLKTITEKNNQLRQTFNKQIVQLTKQIRKYLYEDPKGLFDFFKGSLQSDYELRNSFNELIQDKLAKLNEAYGDVKIGINKEIFHNIYFTNNLDTIWDGNITSEFDIDKYVKDSPKLIDYSDKFLCMRVIVSQHLKAFGKILLDEENSIIKFCTKQKKGGIKIPSFHQIRSQAFIELLQEFRTFFGNLGDIHQKIHTITYEKLVQESKKVENIQKKDYESFKETTVNREQKLLDISNYLVITRSELEQMNLTIRETKRNFQTANEADFHDLETIIIEIREQEQAKRFEFENFIKNGRIGLIEDSKGVRKYITENFIHDEKNIKCLFQILEAFHECTIMLYTNFRQHLKYFSEHLSEIKIDTIIEEWLAYYENKYKVCNILGSTATIEIKLPLYTSIELVEKELKIDVVEENKEGEGNIEIKRDLHVPNKLKLEKSGVISGDDTENLELNPLSPEDDSLDIGNLLTPNKYFDQLKGFDVKSKMPINSPLLSEKEEEKDIPEDNMLRKLHYEAYEIKDLIPTGQIDDQLHKKTSELVSNQAISTNSQFKPTSWLRKKFNIEEELIESFACAMNLKILLQGTLYLTSSYYCFHSFFNHKTIIGSETKIKIPISNVKLIEKRKNVLIFDNSINIVMEDESEFFLTSFLHRDHAFDLLMKLFREEKGEGNLDIQGEKTEDIFIHDAPQLKDNAEVEDTMTSLKDKWIFTEIAKLEESNLERIREKFSLVSESENAENKLFGEQKYPYPIQFITKAIIPLKGKFQEEWAEEAGNSAFEYPEEPDPNPSYFKSYNSDLAALFTQGSRTMQESFLQKCKAWPLFSKSRNNYDNSLKTLSGLAFAPFLPKIVPILETVYKYWLSPNYMILLKHNQQVRVPYATYFHTEVEFHVRQKLIPDGYIEDEGEKLEEEKVELMGTGIMESQNRRIKYRAETEIKIYGQIIFHKKTYFKGQIEGFAIKQIKHYNAARFPALLGDYMARQDPLLEEELSLEGEGAISEDTFVKKELEMLKGEIQRENVKIKKEISEIKEILLRNNKTLHIILGLVGLQILFIGLYYIYNL